MAIEQEHKAAVQEFWNAEPCGARHGEAAEGTPEFFANVERRRIELEPFIAGYADFEGSRGESVLEIGCGLGTDLIRFARNGARVTAIDLTPRSVQLARARLEQEGLEGEIEVGDAENLAFADGSFDRVYSWGVLHHTPGTERAIREALRVVRPGGRVCLMLYARRSWVGFALWARYALARGRVRRSLADVIAHHMESDGTRAFTPRELRVLLGGLEDLRIHRQATASDRRVVGPLARPTGRWLGWYLIVTGRAPI